MQVDHVMQEMQVLQVIQVASDTSNARPVGESTWKICYFVLFGNKSDKEPLESEVMQVRQAHLWVELRVIFLEAIYEEWESKKAVGVFIMLGRKWPQS